jgi:2-polyprenyl-3-methyl-5-hydroxy-6-metoxy-1,4-benzoquinol methylase
MTLSKQAGYYDTPRVDMVPQLPLPLGRVLDIGCGSGATAPLLRERGAERLVGIELNPDAATRARAAYDAVHCGSAEAILPVLQERFDTVLCYDVLEHLVDPWEVLAQTRSVVDPGARLHVSTPNARHLSLAFDLLVRGTFGYTEWGHRDNTHLRWFTPADLEAAVQGAGFGVVARSHPPVSATRAALGRLTRGRAIQFLVWQWHVLAVARS